MTTNKPVHQVRLGKVKAAIFANEGKAGTRFSVSCTRLYKKEGDTKWSFSDSFGRDDLLLLAKVANEAHTWICNRMQDEAKEVDVRDDSQDQE